jgi:glycosyltransferase involved in cell wall biosynthesis
MKKVMKKIIYVPLEDMEERYTVMFNNAFKGYCDYYIYPEFNYDTKIETGEFLDVNKTIIFKSKQLQMIGELFYKGEVNDGDIFVISDIFFPGIESIKYMAELQNIEVKVFAFNHAGRADKDDFVQKLGSWADYSEAGYHHICDGIFFGSEFHANRVIDYFSIDESKSHITGMIWNADYINSIHQKSNTPKKDIIVWPHRISKEKGFDEFIEYAKLNQDKNFLITSSGNKVDVELPSNVKYQYNLSKKEYYQVLNESKYYLSNAHQETFGYTLQEAIHYGCKIAVPNRACYGEMVPDVCLFDDIENVNFEKVPLEYVDKYDNNIEQIIKIITA